MDNKSENVNLSLGDLQQVLNIFDVCTQRGVFRTQELESVGKIYNHLTRFVKQNQPPEAESPQPETQETQETQNNTDQVNNEPSKDL
jgi:hypothetical protein